MMTKNKKITLFVSLLMIFAIGIGTSLAYIAKGTGTLNNTFTVGNIKISIDENKVNELGRKLEGEDEEIVKVNSYDLYPGAIVDKNPFVTLLEGNDAWIFVQVIGIDELESKGVLIGGVGNDGFTDGINALWTKIEGDSETGKDGIYQYIGDLTGGKTEPLFTKVQYSYEADDNRVTSDELSGTIKLRTAAVQKEHIIDTDAYTEVEDFFVSAWE
ncbi:MAG TPA: hypothetical protein H9887_04340 [Candidatus Dorea intestinavium]|nr:hypothetical protein [Candidatus Dorea intestinavium]